jgi:hypothetical protein
MVCLPSPQAQRGSLQEHSLRQRPRSRNTFISDQKRARTRGRRILERQTGDRATRTARWVFRTSPRSHVPSFTHKTILKKKKLNYEHVFHAMMQSTWILPCSEQFRSSFWCTGHLPLFISCVSAVFSPNFALVACQFAVKIVRQLLGCSQPAQKASRFWCYTSRFHVVVTSLVQ